MKKFLLLGCFFFHFFCLVAQKITPSDAKKTATTTTKKYWNPNNLFLGGSLALGLGSGTYSSALLVGANPQIGYSFSNFFDAGLIFNVNFTNAKFIEYTTQYRRNSFNCGAGLLFRFNFTPNLFMQAQPEVNWTQYATKNLSSASAAVEKQTFSTYSFLAGVGYGQRIRGESGFYAIAMMDFLNDKNSPYRNAMGNVIPIIRVGYTFYLRPGKRKITAEN